MTTKNELSAARMPEFMGVLSLGSLGMVDNFDQLREFVNQNWVGGNSCCPRKNVGVCVSECVPGLS